MTLSTIGSSIKSGLDIGLAYGSKVVGCLGSSFVTYFNTPSVNLIGGVVAKANALGSPLFGPAAAVLTTAFLAFAANRLINKQTDIKNETTATILIKTAAIALAVFAGCAAAATVMLFSAAIPVYAAYALGAAVTGASLFLPVKKSPAPEGV